MKLLTYFSRHLKAVELFVSLEVLYLSILLLLPMNTFESAHAYRAFAETGSEVGWGLTIGIVFLFQFFGMLWDKPIIRLVGLIASTGLFFAIGTMFLVADIRSTAWGTYYIFGGLSCFLYTKVFAKWKAGL